MPTKMLGIALRRLTAFALGALALLPAPAAAGVPAPTPTPSECIGDCDNMGQVTVNELLEMVNIALGLDAVSTCAAGDANHDGTITVDEILKAVNLALTRCPLTGSAAAEAASGVDESTNDGVDAAGGIIDFGKASAGGGSSSSPATGGAAAFFSCPAGGSVRIVSCDSSAGISTLTASFKECREIDRLTQATTTRTGTLELTAADAKVCTIGQIPSGVATTSVFTQFTVVALDTAGQTTTQTDKLTDFFTPSGQGCDGPDGRDSIRGALTVQRSLAGTADKAASYAYSKFVVDTVSIPGPAACISQKMINGTLTVDDPVSGRRFSETAQDFVITNEPVENQRVRQRGRDPDCGLPGADAVQDHQAAAHRAAVIVPNLRRPGGHAAGRDGEPDGL